MLNNKNHILTKIVTLLAALMTVSRADNADAELLGLRHRNETTSGALTKVSMAGGLEFFMDGEGFDDQPHISSVMFVPSQGEAVELVGPPLNIDDQIQSSTVSGRLAYTMPPAPAIMGTTDWSSISTHYLANQDENLTFQVKVANTAEATNTACPEGKESKCEVHYNLRYTPMLHDTTPNQVYFDQEIDFLVNPMKAESAITDEMDPVVFIKLSGTRCDSEGFIDYQTRLNDYKLNGLKTRAGDQHPGSVVPEVRWRVGNAFLMESSKHCNFEGTDCWYVKTHPKIDSISEADGYLTGGQALTINGWGLKGTTLDDVEVTVDGVTCKVTSSNLDSITCVTGTAAAVSTEGAQPGSPGLHQRIIKRENTNHGPYWGMFDDGQHPQIEEKILTSFEQTYNNYTNLGVEINGYFKAPETGRYRFHQACDESCRLYMDSTKFDPASTDDPVMTHIVSGKKGWRNYLLQSDAEDGAITYVSDWIDLEKGESYQIKSQMMEWNWADYNTISVEFEKEDTTGHHHSNKAVQRLYLDNELTTEQFNITVKNGGNGGQYQMKFVNPKYDPADRRSIRIWSSGWISDNDAAHWVSHKIRGYWNSVWGSYLAVEKFNTDDDFNTVDSDHTQVVYRCTVTRLVTGGPTFSQASVVPKAGTTSTITVTSAYQQSSAPIDGNFIIACKNAGGDEFETREMNIWTTVEDIQMILHWDIPHLQLKTRVWQTGKYPYRCNGIDLGIHFLGVHHAQEQCVIKSGVTRPIEGGNNVTYKTVVDREYGKNLLFEPIPLEWIRHNAQKPQVLVKVNGLEGVCPDLNCDFMYTQPTSEVTAQALASGTDLTITGTGLPTENVRVALGNTQCGTVTATETEITCTLAALPAAGDWDVQVFDLKGLVPIQTDLAKINVPLVITSVSPAADLNQLGGDELTIAGSGFYNVDGTKITFNDNTACDVKSVSPTEVKCIVAGFDQDNLDTVNGYTTTIEVNAVTNADQNVAIKGTKQSTSAVNPPSASPVLSTELTITLANDYPGDMNSADDFTCQLVKTDDPTETRPLFVMSVDSSAKTVKVKFPGANSGVYTLALEGKGVGRIDGSALDLTVEGRVTAISSLTGSYLGGFSLTIDGVNFSDNKLDNPVKVGPHNCYVTATSATQIQCDVRETQATEISTVNVITFLRTQEEAKNDVTNIFEYAEPVATVSALAVAFDDTTNTQVLTLTGTSMGTDISAIKMVIDGIDQTCLTATDTEATFTLIGLKHETTNKVQIFFPDGFASGYTTVASVSTTPNLISISPATGSAGGTLLTVTGTGFGVDTEGVTLAKASGDSVCETVVMTGYGSFTCMTKAEEITSADTLSLKTSAGTYDCANTLTAADCAYAQETASSPAVTGASIASSSTITITGTDFDVALDAVVIYKGIESDSATIDSATTITATFSSGVPVSSAASSISVSFVPKAGGRRLSLADSSSQLVAAQATAVTLENTLDVTASTSGLTCSFQGGCPYTVTAAGLLTTLKDSPTDKIDVCGKPCVIDEANSSADAVQCTLPLVATAYSASTYDIVTEGTLHDGTWTGTAAAEEIAKVTDGKNMIDLVDSTATDCYFQVQYDENVVGVLDEAKFFISRLTDKDPFVGNLIFQGSNDGTAFTDLWTIDASIHEGWNSKDFEDGSEPSYNIYRFQGKTAGSCRIGEVRLHGIASIDDDNTSYSCTPKLMLDGVATDLEAVTFDSTSTPVLTSMSDRFGSVLGGESITFTGTGFSSSATTTVLIDDKECASVTTTDTTITCTTADKPYKPDTPRLQIHIDGIGYVATKGMTFLYVSKWSDSETWGGDLAPRDGEAVSIPKGQHLLFDIDASPKLSFVAVEGSLIFPPDSDPNHLRKFDAHYILIKNGYMEVGTEDNRYTSKMEITMWSTKYDPNLPIFGNKVIGVNYGSLEMHGIKRAVTWTDLDATADAGATSITLRNKDNLTLDWAVGEEIVIAPSTFSGRDAEQRTIETISLNSDGLPVITFSGPLLTKHYAGVQTFGTGEHEESIEMRAEVGLLTRNVKFMGDPEHSKDNQYGAVIICHSPGDETTQCRIDSIELTMVGQAFILGSYPIHFHMIGTVHKSYVRDNAIHHSFNRAVTIHGVHYLRVQNNVAYHTMGHTIFIEDAVESRNLIENNLILDVRRSWSLLNTDQTPASIWITNPDNIIRGNHAGGSDRYSYWYDLQVTAIGPSFDANVCPENQKLGEFSDNVAHSNGRYGLRIFHNHIPRLHQCDPINYDDTSASYNPPIVAEYKNLVSYKNKRNGAIIERAGAIHWINFKVADNLEVGMEMSRTDDNAGKDGMARIIGGIAIGKTENTEEALDKKSPVGVRTARTELFTMSGVKFYNYNFNKAAAMHTCSHCWHDNNTDSGGRTINVSDLHFDETVQQYVSYTTPWRTIFADATGTLTTKGPNSWLLPKYTHLLQSECEDLSETVGGIVCDNTVQARRISLHSMPSNFFGMRLKVAQYDTAFEAGKTVEELQTYLDDEANYGIVPFKDKKDPHNAWTMPYVTGHRYRLHWESGLDFDHMNVWVSDRWQEADENVNLVFNFTQKLEAVNITADYGKGDLIDNNTLNTVDAAELKSGDYQMRNDTGETGKQKEFELVINGKDETRSKLTVKEHECILGYCIFEKVETGKIEDTPRLWSNKDSWGGTLPVDGDDVVIEPTWWVELDLAETPKLNSLEINGRLTFKDDSVGLPEIKLSSGRVFVRAGEFIIGKEDAPFGQIATIELLGDTESETLTLGGTIDTGNKILCSANMVKFFGVKRDRMARLLAVADAGATTITVDSTLDWAVGDELYIAPSTIQMDYSEYKTITAVDNGVITLDSALAYYHYGKDVATDDLYNGVDIRTEVILLTRNIRIQGEEKDGWGGQILATDLFEMDGTLREGFLIMDNVQISDCSQKDTYRAAIRFDGAAGSVNTTSIISNSAIHRGNDWGLSIINSNNIEIRNNAFVGFRAIGMRIDKTRNSTIDGNFIGDVRGRNIQFLGSTIDKEACVAYCSYEEPKKGTACHDTTFTNNIAAGCPYAGFVAPGHDCDAESPVSFKNNVAHSVGGYGAFAYPAASSSTQGKCMEIADFAAYKTAEPCLVSTVKTLHHKASNITCIDVEKGLSLATGDQEAEEVQITVKDSFFFGESEADDCPTAEACYCKPKFAFMSFQNMNDKKDLHPVMTSSLPLYKSHGEGNWGGRVDVDNSKFSKFLGKSKCGERSVIFERNPDSSDKIPPHFFNNCILEDVDDSGFAFLEKPDPKWANVKDCGNFPCTAPNNLIFSFSGTTYEGTSPSTAVADFTIVPDDETVGGTYGTCERKEVQQAYICQADNIGMMMFESLDDDAWDRALQPIFLLNEETGFNNTLNAMMDHIWDTFYTSQLRMARFPAALATGQDYTLEFSSTPAKKMRFNLDARTGGTKIKIPYPVAGSIQVTANGKKKSYTPWDEEINASAALTKTKGCGENRFVGILNFLEFWLEPGCLLEIAPKDSIMAKVRMDWSMAEFYSDGGTTRFADRLAASLGIESFRIKVVAVYEGSTVVDFEIEAEEKEEETVDADGNALTDEQKAANLAKAQEDAKAALANIKTALIEQATTGTLDIGAPVMGLESSDPEDKGTVLAGDPIPEPSCELSNTCVAPPSGAFAMNSIWIALVALNMTIFM